MGNLIALIIIVAIGYWIMTIISRKQKELATKELLHKEHFLKETQSLLKTEDSSFTAPNIDSSGTEDYTKQVSAYFTAQGYSLTAVAKAAGITLLGLKEKELLVVRCETELKAIKKIDLQLFIAACTLYIDQNPIFKGRSLRRCFSTNRPITEEAQIFVRENPASLFLIEEM